MVTGSPVHPDLQTLAEHAEGLLDPVADRPVVEHVAGCADCRHQLAEVDDVRRRLADLPAETMPADVAERIARGLAAEAGQPDAPAGPARTVIPLRRVSRINRIVLGAAAACVVLLAVVTIAVVALNGSSPRSSRSGTGASAGAAGSAGSFVVTESRTNYADRKALTAAVGQILAGGGPTATSARHPGPVSKGTAGSAGAGSPNDSLNAAIAPPRLPAKLLRLKDRAALLRCVAAQLGEPVGRTLPLGVDLGYYKRRPSAVLILPDPSHADRVAIYVVPPSCKTPRDVELNVPRPAP